MDLARNIYITGIYKIARLNDWKNYIIPFLMGVVFLSVYIYAIPFVLALKIISLLLLTVIGTASYGYLLNNIFDQEEDKLAGKSNSTEKMTGISKAAFILIFLAVAHVPWLFLPFTFLNFGLFVLQLVLLAAYSIPPLRLKRYVHIGVITDALYNSVIMVFVIVFTIREYAQISPENGIQILIVLFIVLFLKGLRGILLHQLADRKNDRKAGIRTFVSCYGPRATNMIVSTLLLPLEFIILTILVMIFSSIIPRLNWLYVIFIFYSFLRLRLWNIRTIPVKQHKFIFLFTLNDFYEEWLPYYAIVLLAIWDVHFLFLLVPYILFFPTFFRKLSRDVPEAILNFKSDFKRKFQTLSK